MQQELTNHPSSTPSSAGEPALPGIGLQLRAMVGARLLAEKGDFLMSLSRTVAAVSMLEEAHEWKSLRNFSEKMIETCHAQALIGNEDACKVLLFSSRANIRAYRLGQGPLNPTAWSVEQGEFAVSSTEPIGTHSVENCLSLALYHPESRTTVLAHIDNDTELCAAEKLIALMPAGKLQARLMGERGAPGSASEKLDAALLALSKRNVEILSSDVSHFGTPQAWVLDPRDFSFKIEVPGRCSERFEAMPVLCWLTPAGKELRKSFDLRSSQEFLPQYLDSRQNYPFSISLWDNEPSGLYRRLVRGKYEPRYFVHLVEMNLLFAESYDPLHHRVKERIAELEMGGVHIPDEAINSVFNLAHWSGRWAGPGAFELNRPLFEGFCASMFVVENGSASVNEEYFRNII